MCDNENNQDCECIYKVLKTILLLQNQDFNCSENLGCDKPYLGPTPSVVCYNTRPINLYNCATGELWEFPYTVNGITGTSTVFRVESLDNCCCTCRILYPNPDTTEGTSEFSATNEFFTINLNCVGAIKCLNDTFVELC